MSKGGRLLPRLGLALAAAAAALGGAELAVRLASPQPPAVLHEGLLRGMFTRPGDHPVRTDELQGVVHVNAQGFVDEEWGPRQAGVLRVVLLGDSFVQAAQVPLQAGYGRVLADELSTQAGRPIEVLSLGVPGAGTATALLLAREHLAELQPDVLLYGLTTSNDVLNNHPSLDPKTDKPFFSLQGGTLVRVAPQEAGLPPWARGPLWQHSHLARWAGRSLWARAEVADRLARGGGLPAELRVHDPAGGVVWEEAWQVTDALVGALAAEAGDRVFATVLVPDQVECSRQGRARAVDAWPELATWDTDAARLRAGELAAGHGPVIDLCAALLAAERPDQPLYLAEDGHWTTSGHRVAAQATATALLPLLPR